MDMYVLHKCVYLNHLFISVVENWVRFSQLSNFEPGSNFFQTLSMSHIHIHMNIMIHMILSNHMIFLN